MPESTIVRRKPPTKADFEQALQDILHNHYGKCAFGLALGSCYRQGYVDRWGMTGQTQLNACDSCRAYKALTGSEGDGK